MIKAPALVAFRAKLPPRDPVVGKIIVVLEADKSHSRIFYRSHDLGVAEFHKWEALSFDERVVPYLHEYGVEFIDYDDKVNLWRLALLDFMARAVAATHNPREGRQLYVRREHWQAIPRYYTPGWTEQTIWLTSPPPGPWVPIASPAPPLAPSPQGSFGL